MYRVVTKLTWEGTFIQRPIGSEGAKPRSCRGRGGGNVLGRADRQCKGPEALAYFGVFEKQGGWCGWNKVRRGESNRRRVREVTQRPGCVRILVLSP